MSLFDLQDVCIAIGSIATLDLPMVVDLIGIYGLKGPYCTLTTTDWFLQALSVITRGSWGDVSRRFTMIRWAAQNRRPSSLKQAAAADLRRKFVSGQFDEENPFVQNSSVLLVQPDKGVSVLVVDRIGDYLPQSIEKSRVLVIPVGARHKCQQAGNPGLTPVDFHFPKSSSRAQHIELSIRAGISNLVLV
ncbi:GDP-L-galactose phosphorylase 2-like [Dorcoceras hygrometricum]|uniref:GDP-L-galactose phosphorylase 2-like n=1 Tax=Dorcoceras hygrometricum TaxID=472368 RepID=A0A2Z7AXL5_9LAMI|nr:GDP-L-galactose phosphorylase 2-like [Dorcoceras hygrometricum]